MKILVIGGRSGIGRVIALHLYDAGAQVCVATRRPRNDLPLLTGVTEVDVDVTDSVAVMACVRSATPDHVIATCTDVIRRPLALLSLEECRRSFETKFWGQFNVARAAIEYLPSHGSLILFSGIASQMHFPNLGLAGVVNAAIEKLTIELAASGPIRVNCVSPGIVVMPPDVGGHQRSADSLIRLEAMLPAGRPVSATQIAAMVHHLIVNEGANGMIAQLDAGHQTVSGSRV